MSIHKNQLSSNAEARVSLPIEGMTCASCVGRVEAALNKVEGVVNASVNLATELADIHLKAPVDRLKLIEAIEKVGYEVPLKPRKIAFWCMHLIFPITPKMK